MASHSQPSSSSSSSSSSPEFHTYDDTCLQPFEYLCQIPGKDVRGALIDCFNQWLGLPDDKVIIIKDIVKSLHNASLLVDDIEDNSKLRRGIPVAHSIFGVANTINCANYVYFKALEQCLTLECADAMNICVLELLNLHRGQGRDILWRENCQCPSEEQYKQMVEDKTGGLFRLAVGLMQSCIVNNNSATTNECSDNNDHSTANKSGFNFTKLLNLLGLYFQIRDDYLNISSKAYMQTKSFCEDLTEGKFSFPIIHAVNSNLNDSRLLNILRQRTEDIEIKRYAVSYMNKCGSITYTRQVLKSLKQQVDDEIAFLGGHAKLVRLVQDLDRELDDKSDVSSDTSFSSAVSPPLLPINSHGSSSGYGIDSCNNNSKIISTL